MPHFQIQLEIRPGNKAVTVEPPNKGHVGDNINSAVLSFIERLSSFRGSKCTKTIGHVIFGTSNSVLYREVYYTVSLFRRVHYRRFHCISSSTLIYSHRMMG